MSGTIKEPPTDHLQSFQPGHPSVTFEKLKVHGKEINYRIYIYGTVLIYSIVYLQCQVIFSVNVYIKCGFQSHFQTG